MENGKINMAYSERKRKRWPAELATSNGAIQPIDKHRGARSGSRGSPEKTEKKTKIIAECGKIVRIWNSLATS